MHRNKLVLLLVLFVLCGLTSKQAKSQDSIQVQIKIEQLEKAPVVLNYNDFGQFKSAQGVEVRLNEYLFKLPNKGYTLIQFLVNSPQNLLMSESGFTPKPMPKVLVSPTQKTTIIVKDGDQLNLEVISKDKEVKLFEKYSKIEREYYQQSWDALKNRKEDSGASDNRANAESFEKVKENFVHKHQNSFAALAVFSTYYTRLSAADASNLLNSLAPKYPDAPIRLSIAEKLNLALQTTSGNKIPSFEVIDLHGNVFNSEAIPAKYLLLDFWGSWCQPCRASHPELKKTYDKYKPLGFEILGIAYETGSLENQLKNWKKAIQDDEIDWINTLNSTENNLVKKFGVTSYPTKILVDSEGNIIYRSGQNNKKLEDILHELFQ